MQLNHYNTKFNKQTLPITLVCDNVNKALNIGSLFRIADAFGIEELIFCGKNISIGKRITKTSRATENFVNYKIEADIEAVLLQLKAIDYYTIALEITENSAPLHQFQLKTQQPITLIIGNENFGVSDSVLKQCNATLHINMYGNNSSMNVVQAASIALYEFSKQINQ